MNEPAQAMPPRERPRDTVTCMCGFHVFNGEVIRARVIRLLPSGAEAKCSRCKRWNLVPITYCPLLEER